MHSFPGMTLRASMTTLKSSAVSGPAAARRAPRAANLIIVSLVAAGFALTVLAFYPGYLTNDATFVYGFIKDWRFGDWQSPVMSMLWWLIDPIAPGPGSMFLL